MKGDPQVLDLLNEILTGELTAINQYFLHAKMLQNWGYLALGRYLRKESIDEMKHAERLTDRILFLEGLPNLQRLGKLAIGESPKEQFANDAALEYAAIKRLNDAIRRCRDIGDNGTEALLTEILVSEEEHVDWIETQQELMRQIGDAAYLAQQIHKHDD